MKQIFASIILIAVLNQTFNAALFMWSLNLKKAELNAEICSKTHNPSIQCQGICDLVEHLNHTKEMGKKALQNILEQEIFLFCAFYPPFNFQNQPIIYLESLSKNFAYVSLVGGLWRNRILRPPAHC
jgi:hypothetical protein